MHTLIIPPDPVSLWALPFLQGTIGSTFFQQVNSIIQSPEKLPTILGAALPDSSNFFMQFIAMRALFLIWLRLCVPHGGVWQNWMHYLCCPAFCCSTCNTGGCTTRAGVVPAS